MGVSLAAFAGVSAASPDGFAEAPDSAGCGRREAKATNPRIAASATPPTSTRPSAVRPRVAAGAGVASGTGGEASVPGVALGAGVGSGAGSAATRVARYFASAEPIGA